jgi:hypothetical protein
MIITPILTALLAKNSPFSLKALKIKRMVDPTHPKKLITVKNAKPSFIIKPNP